ncbi:unnamed protein product [Trifolium pratense]|nr:unnamed protein product [Trifolium pratense]
MQKQSAYVRELYAITEALAKFRHYLIGHKFVIKTDQRSLKSLTDQSIQTPEQQHWLHKFLGYDFTIEYKPGVDNIAADSLSRSFCFALSVQTSQLVAMIHTAVNDDPALAEIRNQCLLGTNTAPHYQVKHDMLFWKNRLVIPQKPELIQLLLTEFHSSALGGHAGITRTKARVASQFFWPTMAKDIKEFVSKCLICQQAKHSTAVPAGLLHPLPIPQQIWEDLSMDFIIGLPPSHTYTVILVVVDRLSKYSHFIPLKGDYTSSKVAEAFVNTIVKLHGFPKTIVSDRDRVFTSQFWQHLFKISGTTLAMSTAYHPQTDGQSEAVNKCLELYLRCFTSDSPKQWVKLLPWAEFWYNTSFHTSIGMTPFKVVYGRDPPSLIRYEVNNDDPPLLQQLLTERDDTIITLKANLARAQQIMKKFADNKRRFVEFQVGDMVLVKLQPYRQHSVVLRRNQKLSMRYFGPFPVIERIGQVAYKLMLPPSAKIHPVFHVSALKLCKGEHSTQLMPLPLTTTEHGPMLSPIAIIDRRTIIQNAQPVQQVQVQWEGLLPTETTWEKWDEFHSSYPNLEDKVLVNEGSNVMIKDNNMSWQEKIVEGKGQKQQGTQGHVVSDPFIMGPRRGMRVRTSNRKYSSDQYK